MTAYYAKYDSSQLLALNYGNSGLISSVIMDFKV